MSAFRVNVAAVNPKNEDVVTEPINALVDTGSELTWLPAGELTAIGITPRRTRTFIMASGERLQREVGYAILRAEGYETTDEVVFGEKGDQVLLGVRTLEGFAVTVDPIGHRLVAQATLACGAGHGCSRVVEAGLRGRRARRHHGAMAQGNGRLAGKVAIVTGGTSGMGEATVERYVAEGARVMIAGRRQDAGNAIAERLGADAAFTRTDVTREAEVERLVAATVERWGRVDILFNNAGAGHRYRLVEEFDADEFLADVWTLVGSCFMTVKYAAPIMKRQGAGSIINNGSTAGVTTDGSSANYSACKAGMIQVTKVWATELISHSVRVNCISPGAITTPIFWGGAGTQTAEENRARMERLDRWWIENRPQNRPGHPDDIAHAAVFLGSDESLHISGHNLMVDVGATVTRGAFDDLHAMQVERARAIADA